MAKRRKKDGVEQLLDPLFDLAASGVSVGMSALLSRPKNKGKKNSPGCLAAALYTLLLFPLTIAIFFAILGLIFLLLAKPFWGIVAITVIIAISFFVAKKKDEKKRKIKEQSSNFFEIKSEIANSPIEISKAPADSSPLGVKTPADYLAQLETEQFCRRESDAHYKLVVIDFETTGIDPSFHEILQVSIIDDAENVLINQYCKPKHVFNWPEAYDVNHISPGRVEKCPYFSDVAPYVHDILLRADTVIAYSYPFEPDFLRAYGIDPDDLTWGTDPMKLACKSYNKQYHSSRSRMKLTAAAEMIGYTYNPHDALEDVKATLHVYQALQQPGQIAVKRLPEEKKPTPVRTGGARYKPNPNANPNHPLYGKTIVITGELPIDREEASLKAADLGAKVRVGISPRTQILVCGERLAEWSEQYGEKSYKIKKAEKINEEGGSIELMPGEKFMALLNQPAGEPEKVSTVDT